LEAAKTTVLSSQRKEADSFGRAAVSGRILIIDDDEINRHIMSRQLERQGHTVVSVVNGREAIALLKRVPFDIILLDVMMPEMNGFQVLELIKQDEKLRDMPVIVISALETPRRWPMHRDGGRGLLAQGVRSHHPGARIASIMDRAQLRRERDRYVAPSWKRSATSSPSCPTRRSMCGPPSPSARQSPLPNRLSFIPSLSPAAISSATTTGQTANSSSISSTVRHGIEAALLSVTIMNLLKAETLPNTDFSNPAGVLST
jgi:sigma-B regulation protein RsbU (phosphoserine phosphatase)